MAQKHETEPKSIIKINHLSKEEMKNTSNGSVSVGAIVVIKSLEIRDPQVVAGVTAVAAENRDLGKYIQNAIEIGIKAILLAGAAYQPKPSKAGCRIMTARFQAQLATSGRDWSDNKLSDQATAFLYEQITPDETVAATGLVTRAKREKITREFLAKDSPNVIVFYPLFEGDIPAEFIEDIND